MSEVNKFFKSFNVRLNTDDLAFIRKHLTLNEQVLFFRMQVIDQKHTIEMTRTLANQIASDKKLDAPALIKASLLHDCGKALYPFRVRDRVIGTLLKKFLNSFYLFLSEKGKASNKKKSLAKMIYYHYQHPRLGSELAIEVGVPALTAKLIASHQDPFYEDDTPELKLLKQIDMNE
jgi:hypothetical protein